MPAYPQGGLAKLLRSNQQGFLFNNESVSVPEMSVAFQLERISHSAYPWGASFELVFSGDPGTFEVDIMVANTDQLANYLQLAMINTLGTSTVTGAHVARYDMATNVWPKFVAAYVRTLTNAVNVTMTVTR